MHGHGAALSSLDYCTRDPAGLHCEVAVPRSGSGHSGSVNFSNLEMRMIAVQACACLLRALTLACGLALASGEDAGADSYFAAASPAGTQPRRGRAAWAAGQHLLVNPVAVDVSVAGRTLGVELVIGQATRLGRPLLGEDTPADVNWGNAYPNVAFEAEPAARTEPPGDREAQMAPRYRLWWNGLSVYMPPSPIPTPLWNSSSCCCCSSSSSRSSSSSSRSRRCRRHISRNSRSSSSSSSSRSRSSSIPAVIAQACPADYAHLEPGCVPVPARPPYTNCVCPVPNYRWPLWRPPGQNVTSEWSLSYCEKT